MIGRQFGTLATKSSPGRRPTSKPSTGSDIVMGMDMGLGPKAARFIASSAARSRSPPANRLKTPCERVKHASVTWPKCSDLAYRQEGKLTFVNMHFEHIFGHSAEMIVPLAWRKLIHSGRHKRVWPWTKRHGNAVHRFVGHGNWERAPCQTVVCALSRRAGDYPWLRRISRRSFCTY